MRLPASPRCCRVLECSFRFKHQPMLDRQRSIVGPYQEFISHFFANLYRGKDASGALVANETVRIHWILGRGWICVFTIDPVKFTPIFSFFIPIISSGFYEPLNFPPHRIVYAKIILPSSPSAFLCDQFRPLFREIERFHPASNVVW